MKIKRWADITFFLYPAGLLLLALLSGCAGRADSQEAQNTTAPIVIRGDRSSTERLTLKLTLSSPSDLKVREGDQVSAGQVLSDRLRDRQRLEAQKRQLQLQIQQLQQPIAAPPPARSIPEVAGLPPASFLDEVAAVERQKVIVAQHERSMQQQQRMLDMLDSMPDANLPEATVPHETERLAQRQQELNQANADLELTEAQLAQAQQERQHEEYLHSLEMSKRAIAIEQGRLQRAEQLQNQQEQENQRSFQIAQITAQLQVIDTQLAQLSAVRSPYAGTIQRVSYEGQTDQNLVVELTLVTAADSSSSSPTGSDRGNAAGGNDRGNPD